MHHETTLIATVVLGLVFAFCCGLVASKLRLPPLVGYLLAGVAVGPFTPGFVADGQLASQLAEIGVVLLMFGVGLHFSVADLMAVRRIAIPGALVQILFATLLGIGIAWIWGWSFGAGLVFGLSMSVASTVVLLRALEGQNGLDTDNGRIAVGWLIVEDLAMVLALVLLPAVSGALGGEAAEGQSGLLATIGLTLGKVALFLALMLVVGRRVIPWLLGAVARTGSRELFTLAVLAIALGIAFGSAELFDVSFALGAFFAGVVLSESDLSHQAAADSLPLQDAFAVLFFVSVGMLFDPGILVREPLAVVAVVLVIIAGKSLAAFGIVLAFGYTIETALSVSASLAQIGEFSFILTGLGVGLKLLPADGRDLILAGALLCITLNPLVFVGAQRLSRKLASRPDILAKLERKRSQQRPPDIPMTVEAGLRDHAVLVGYGRVGGLIGLNLIEQGLPVVAIEQDRRRLEAMRNRGVHAVYGNATLPAVLEAANLRVARLLVIATPDAHQNLRMLELARLINPALDIAVRAHSEAEVRDLAERGVGVAMMAERELALALTDYTLRSFGIPTSDAQGIVAKARGRAWPFRAFPEAARGVPELRQHRDEAAAES